MLPRRHYEATHRPALSSRRPRLVLRGGRCRGPAGGRPRSPRSTQHDAARTQHHRPMPRDVGGGETQIPGAAVTTATTWLELSRRHVLERVGMYVVQLLGDRGAGKGRTMLGTLGDRRVVTRPTPRPAGVTIALTLPNGPARGLVRQGPILSGSDTDGSAAASGILRTSGRRRTVGAARFGAQRNRRARASSRFQRRPSGQAVGEGTRGGRTTPRA
jgi:hypothetical protein